MLIKLSEAIRRGARLRPQSIAEGDYSVINGKLCSCAMGAAYEGIGWVKVQGLKYYRNYEECIDEKILEAWPYVSKVVPMPCSCKPEDVATYLASPIYLVMLAQHLNDSHAWTREAIADFIATQEKLCL